MGVEAAWSSQSTSVTQHFNLFQYEILHVEEPRQSQEAFLHQHHEALEEEPDSGEARCHGKEDHTPPILSAASEEQR